MDYFFPFATATRPRNFAVYFKRDKRERYNCIVHYPRPRPWTLFPDFTRMYMYTHLRQPFISRREHTRIFEGWPRSRCSACLSPPPAAFDLLSCSLLLSTKRPGNNRFICMAFRERHRWFRNYNDVCRNRFATSLMYERNNCEWQNGDTSGDM